MKKRSLGKTQSLSVIITTGLALFNLGVFGLLLLSGNRVSQMIRQNFEVQVFLNKDVDASQIQSFGDLLRGKEYLAKNQADAIRFVSKEEAGANFRKQTGENFAEFLGENPLRDAYSFKVSEAYLDNEKLGEIKKELSQMPGVFEVVYIENLAGTIQENLARISILLISISLMLLITVVWLIRNTIRLSVYSSRFLIRSMELVGAKPGFIQMPFIKNMAIQGLWAGILSICLFQGAIYFGSTYYPPFKEILPQNELYLLEGGLILFGIVLNSICAYLSVSRFLGKALDYMYAN
ncbi:MAG TPA: permease-like cell division protein FtsX [Catalimonadaceae bacterium]|nr:permease-like cell division protein FtsX [Catalimonadaceae bacterium]